MGMKNPYPFISTIHIHITLWKGVMRCTCECKNWQDMTNCYKRWQRWKNVPVNAIASSHPSDKRCWPQLGIVCVCLTFVCLLLHRPLLPWITLGSRWTKDVWSEPLPNLWSGGRSVKGSQGSPSARHLTSDKPLKTVLICTIKPRLAFLYFTIASNTEQNELQWFHTSDKSVAKGQQWKTSFPLITRRALCCFDR